MEDSVKFHALFALSVNDGGEGDAPQHAHMFEEAEGEAEVEPDPIDVGTMQLQPAMIGCEPALPKLPESRGPRQHDPFGEEAPNDEWWQDEQEVMEENLGVQDQR